MASAVLSLAGWSVRACLGFVIVRSLRVELPSTVPARLWAFAIVLVLAAGGGWFAGHGVGPIQLPPPDQAAHSHLEDR